MSKESRRKRNERRKRQRRERGGEQKKQRHAIMARHQHPIERQRPAVTAEHRHDEEHPHSALVAETTRCFAIDEEDAEKFFRQFLIENPGMVDKNPAHEAIYVYAREKRLGDISAAVERQLNAFFNKLAHKWGIYDLRLGEAQAHYIKFYGENRRLKLLTSIAQKAAASYAEEKGLSELQREIVEAYYLQRHADRK